MTRFTARQMLREGSVVFPSRGKEPGGTCPFVATRDGQQLPPADGPAVAVRGAWGPDGQALSVGRCGRPRPCELLGRDAVYGRGLHIRASYLKRGINTRK